MKMVLFIYLVFFFLGGGGGGRVDPEPFYGETIFQKNGGPFGVLGIYGHFPKRYSKQKRINVTFECRWHVLHFLVVAGPQLNAVVLQGSARFAQGSRKVLIVQLGRCQKPESR